MANPGEWITFAALCQRVPGKSPRTLRRYIRARVISFRQLVRGGRLEFNWRTVERELRSLETEGINASAAAVIPYAGEPSELVREVAELRFLVRAIARRVGVEENEMGAVFGDEQRKVG